jgi:hypothetical protein
LFDPLTIGLLLVNLALAYHVFRTGQSPMWLAALGLISLSSFVLGGIALLATFGLWGAYVFFAILPTFWNSRSARSFRASAAHAADPGRDYREKKRQVEQVGSVDAKRALAEESLKRGLFDEAVTLYESAMQGPLGGGDPVLLKGLGRAKLLSGDGAAAEALFVQLRQVDPAAMDADVELDYARALEAQGKNDEAIQRYEGVAPRYPGEEARCRFALLLEKTGQTDRAQAVFREIIASVKNAPSHYRSRQSEWLRTAKQHLKN